SQDAPSAKNEIEFSAPERNRAFRSNYVKAREAVDNISAVSEASSAESSSASPSVFSSAREFIDAVLPHARAAASTLGLNPLFLTAQAALETGWGKYVIRDRAGQSTHNFFNIKADRSWQGEK